MADNDGLIYSQDFVLDSCKIVTGLANPYDFKYMVVEVNYFEDIFNMYITGSLVVNDTNNFLNSLGFNGNEYLLLTFSKPGMPEKIEKTFRIFKVSDRTLVKDQNENYVLHFCSEELILSEQYKISKSYRNKKISDMVSDIVANQLLVSPKKFLPANIEETKGVRDLIVPNLKPFEALSWLSTYAISNTSKTEGSPYLFYENANGFNFKSLQSLFSSKVYKTYNVEAKNLRMPDDPRVQDMGRDLVNILHYDTISNFDSINLINSGALANRLIAIDPIRQTYTVNNYDYGTNFDKGQKLNKFGLLSNAKNRKGDTSNVTYDAVLKVTTTNTGQSSVNQYIKSHQPTIKDVNVETTVPYRTAQLAQIGAIRYRVLLPGDPLLTVGSVVTFNLPDIKPDDLGRIADKYYSGNYLVTAVRHKIDQENKFLSLVELSKESLPTAYDVVDNALPAWKDLRSK
jgi:hypothetical protein